MPAMSLNIPSCSLLVYFRGSFTAGLNQIYICLAEYAWFQGSREVVIACKMNLSSSQFPFHCMELFWQCRTNGVVFFSFFLVWALCILGSPVPFWKQFLCTVSRKEKLSPRNSVAFLFLSYSLFWTMAFLHNREKWSFLNVNKSSFA